MTYAHAPALLLLLALAPGCASSPAASDAAMPDGLTPRDAEPDAAPDAPADAAPPDVAPPDMAPPDAADAGAFTLTSPAFVHAGTLPAEYTCDGVGHSPPLQWTGAPAGTAEYALLMTTLARDGLKWNWVLHSIPRTATSLPAASTGVGVHGITSDGPALAYAPPCSRGPGPMMYTFTLYALSGHPTLPDRNVLVTGAVVTESIRALTLASSALTVTYTR